MPTETYTFKLADYADRRKTPTLARYRYMTREEASALCSGDHALIRRRDGRAGRVKINGAPRVWKRDAARFELPVKHGMYEFATFTPQTDSNGRAYIGTDCAALIVAVSEGAA